MKLDVNEISNYLQNYFDKYEDSVQQAWLEILERDEWKCKACGEDDVTLHVHHMRYDDDFEPWEYDDKDLNTLCEDCHKCLHYILKFNGGHEYIWGVVQLWRDWEFESFERFYKESSTNYEQ